MPETIRLAQIGVGYWGTNLLRNFAALRQVEVVAACDQRVDVCRQLAGLYPGIRTTQDFRELLADNAIQGIVIATETSQHFELAAAALKADKHVFVEKPMAQNVEEASQLVKLSQDRDRRLMVGHLLLYHPAFRYVENMIDEGNLGEIFYMYSVRVNLGIIRQRENALESLAPHDLSIALRFLKSDPVAVSANGQAYLQREIQDVAFATVHFGDGKLAHIHTSWLDPHKVRKVTVVGSKKMAVIDDVESTEKVRIYDKGVDLKPGEKRYVDYADAMTIRSGDIHIPKIDMREPLRLECEHFVECIRTGNTPRSDGGNGLAVVKILEAAQKSLADRGATVEL